MRSIITCLLLSGLAGCAGDATLTVSGELTYQGVAVPGEIAFEPIDANDKPVGRATSVTVSNSGFFRASLPTTTSDSQAYRLSVRVAPPNPQEPSGSAINSSAFGAGVKTVPLRRDLRNGQKLVLAITQ